MKNIKKFQEKINKKGFETQLSNPKEWISTGNLALNYLMTGHFYKGIPSNRQTVLAGPNSSGKSFIACNIAKDAQDKGYTVIYVDTEFGMDEAYMNKIGMNTDPDSGKFLPVQVTSIEETAELLGEMFGHFDETEDKLCIVLDSLSMLGLKKELEGFEDNGKMQEDTGRTAKKYKQLLRLINSKTGNRNIVFVTVMHAYENQDLYSGKKYNVSGGESCLFIPSISMMFDKGKLKDGKEITGFRMKVETVKTRFDQVPGKKIEIEVPYEKGLDPYEGLLPVLEEEGLVSKTHAWYSYTDQAGQHHKFQKNDLDKHIDEILAQYEQKELVETFDERVEDDVTSD